MSSHEDGASRFDNEPGGADSASETPDDSQSLRDTDQAWPPPSKDQNLPGAGPFGMWIFLASLSMSFLAALVGYIYIRWGKADWIPEGVTGVPDVLWGSTAVILLLSLFSHFAKRAVQADQQARLRGFCVAAMALAVAFCALQVFAWREMWPYHHYDGGKMYAVTFVILTMLHSVHVLGGIVVQATVTIFAYRGAYWSLHYPWGTLRVHVLALPRRGVDCVLCRTAVRNVGFLPAPGDFFQQPGGSERRRPTFQSER